MTTYNDLTGQPDAAFDAMLARIEARDEAAEGWETVERVARAICAAAYHREVASVWDRMGPQLQSDYRRLAVAALFAQQATP